MKRLSLDAAALAVLLAGGLFLASGAGSAQRPRVERLVDDGGPSFSPDGRTIVFHRLFSMLRYGVTPHPVVERSAVLLMRADGSRKRVLKHARATFEHSASFSPDGRSIVFVRDERIYLMRTDGSGARPIRRDFVDQACPRLSPDGSRISFWRGTSGKGGAYFVINADGSGLRRIAGGIRFAWGCPAWFPDSRRLVLVKDFELYVVSADGATSKRITDDDDGTLYRPAVSPDGRWIACDGERGHSGRYGIIVMRADGSAIRGITTTLNELQTDNSAAWSPDGARIAFSGWRSPFRRAGIYVVHRDGSGLRRLSMFAR